MRESTNIFMRHQSGMTTSVIALAEGFFRDGISVCIIVPTQDDAALLKKERKISEDIKVIAVTSLSHMHKTAASSILIFDDAIRCGYEWRKHQNGLLSDVVNQFPGPLHKGLTSAYLFHYMI